MTFLLRFPLVALMLAMLGLAAAPAWAQTNVVRTEQVTARLLAHAPQGVLGMDADEPAASTAPASPGWTLPGSPPPQGLAIDTPQGTPDTTSATARQAASAAASAQAASPVWLGLAIKHAPGWHTYWQNPGDSGLPTTLEWTLPPGVEADPIAWPVPEKIFIGDMANFGYEGEVLLPVRLRFTPDFRPGRQTLPIALKATWLVCKEECIPQTGEFQLDLPLRSSTALDGALFEAAWAARPQTLPAEGHSLALSDNGKRLHLRLAGLPAEWHGQKLELFSETPEVLVNAARAVPGTKRDPQSPSISDSRLGPRDWQQGWDGADWTASVPVSDMRASSPDNMALVVAHAGQGWRAELPVQGTWPAHTPMAQVSPALQAALEANARQAAGTPGTATSATSLGTWLLALGGALIGGLLLNLMPCVFPVLAIKLMGFAQTHDRARTRAGGLGYVLGVVLTCLALGALMLALRAAGQQLGWGFQLQSPWMVAGLAILFTLIALNLFGLFEVPGFLANALPERLRAHPLLDHFYAGVLAVVVATPCTAPFMGASVGLAIGMPAWQALGIFGALGLGLALPVLVAMAFPGLGARLPKSGRWMHSLRQFLGFPMLATVVWLLWVLGQQVGLDGVTALLAVLIALALLLWTLRLSARHAWLARAASALALAWTVHWAWPQLLAEPPAPQTASAAGPADATGQTWQSWSPEAVTQAIASSQPVFVDYTAAWCVTCQFNKKTTLSDPAVLADFAKRGVLLLRADWTRQDPRITASLQSLGRSGVPVYVLHAPGREPQVFTEVLRASALHKALAALPDA